MDAFVRPFVAEGTRISGGGGGGFYVALRGIRTRETAEPIYDGFGGTHLSAFLFCFFFFFFSPVFSPSIRRRDRRLIYRRLAGRLHKMDRAESTFYCIFFLEKIFF